MRWYWVAGRDCRSFGAGAAMKKGLWGFLVAGVTAVGIVLVLCSPSRAAGKGSPKLAAADMGIEIELTNQKVTSTPINGTVSLPAGTYTVKSFTLVGKQSGRLWKIKCPKPFGKMESFSVTADETATLDVGPPFFPKASAHQLPPQYGHTVLIGLVVQGKSEEVYSPAVTAGSQQVPPPKFKIVNESGKTAVAAGQLEYGSGGSCRYSWRVPAGFRGKYRIEAQPSLGPFEVSNNVEWHTASSASNPPNWLTRLLARWL